MLSSDHGRTAPSLECGQHGRDAGGLRNHGHHGLVERRPVGRAVGGSVEKAPQDQLELIVSAGDDHRAGEGVTGVERFDAGEPDPGPDAAPGVLQIGGPGLDQEDGSAPVGGEDRRQGHAARPHEARPGWEQLVQPPREVRVAELRALGVEGGGVHPAA